MLEINFIDDYWYFNLSGNVTDEEVEALFNKLTELTNSNRRFKFIADSTNLENISITNSSYSLYNWMYSNRDRIPYTLVCNSLIITSTVLKDLINGVFYIIPPLSPTRICSTLDEGIIYLREFR